MNATACLESRIFKLRKKPLLLGGVLHGLVSLVGVVGKTLIPKLDESFFSNAQCMQGCSSKLSHATNGAIISFSLRMNGFVLLICVFCSDFLNCSVPIFGFVITCCLKNTLRTIRQGCYGRAPAFLGYSQLSQEVC